MTTATTKVSCAIFAILCGFSYMRKVSLFATLCMCAVFLGGCDPDLTQAQTTAICHALVSPIYYNSYNPKSGRYAAHLLVITLKQRNQIWQGLHCHVR
jgi:PBP1b-binding outer membrane lipoprotein LpoB